MARYSVNGRKIRETRLSKGIGSKDLAKKAGISERTLLEIEKGMTQATEETFFGICKALKIDAGECLADEPVAPVPAPAKGDADAAKATA